MRLHKFSLLRDHEQILQNQYCTCIITVLLLFLLFVCIFLFGCAILSSFALGTLFWFSRNFYPKWKPYESYSSILLVSGKHTTKENNKTNFLKEPFFRFKYYAECLGGRNTDIIIIANSAPTLFWSIQLKSKHA